VVKIKIFFLLRCCCTNTPTRCTPGYLSAYFCFLELGLRMALSSPEVQAT